MRCLDEFLAVAAQVALRQVVTQDENDVRSRGWIRRLQHIELADHENEQQNSCVENDFILHRWSLSRGEIRPTTGARIGGIHDNRSRGAPQFFPSPTEPPPTQACSEGLQ